MGEAILERLRPDNIDGLQQAREVERQCYDPQMVRAKHSKRPRIGT
jgi:hypothetical protein